MHTKLIAYYLPQFHQTDENDRWWGKGFTEWMNTSSAESLYFGHYQPKIPYKENYYDLSDSNAIANQAKLAKEYGVDGFCFYHYWFEGEMLLHKPAELLLEHSEIDMPFCFMWANETWRSTWYCDRDEYHVLKMQTYGDEEEWKMHFNYLLPFLKDPRYICKEGKPIITLYHWNEIPRVLAMIEMWNELAKENGLPGIYFIQEETGQEYIGVEKDNPKTVFGPTISFKKGFGDDKIRFSNIIGNKMSCLLRNKFLNFLLLETRHYIKITKLMYRHAKKKTKDNYYLCAVAGWDNTPRKQKGGRILLGCTPSRFKRHLKDLLALSYRYQKEFLFIFAWNEWAEGAYLEPDEKYKFAYLEAVKECVKGRK